MRISDEDWADFEAAAKVAGLDRAAVVRDFIQWYIRRPGAKMPKRPAEQEPTP